MVWESWHNLWIDRATVTGPNIQPLHRVVSSPFNGQTKTMVSTDPTTQSNYLDVYTTHVSLDWLVNFDNETISGSATHKLTVASPHAKEVM